MARPDDSGHLAGGSSVARGDAAVVFAAGKGTRMRSSLPKVLHQLAGKPLLDHVLRSLRGVGFDRPTVVVGYGKEIIQEVVGDRCDFVTQIEQRGTGDAARVALESLPDTTRRIVVVHGDDPLIESESLREMLDLQDRTGASVVLLTALVKDTRSLGRVVRNDHGEPIALVQESELTAAQRSSHEVNLGAYVFNADFLRYALGHLEPHPPKGEYYLTDVIATAAHAGDGRIAAVTVPAGDEILGVNDLVQLEQANRVVHRRTNRRLMESGVTIVDSGTTFIDEEVEIAADTIVHPFTIITGETRIGASCQIGPSTRILTSHIGARCEIVSSTIEGAQIDDDVTVGPYAHLRPGARIGSGAEIGNYAEIKKSTLGPGSRMHHFSYLGDAQAGANVNIGAGTITCNYDGRVKSQTVIGDRVFLGSDTMLVAPLTVGEGAATGAGSVVTKNVPPGKLAVGVPARVVKDVPSDESESDSRETRA